MESVVNNDKNVLIPKSLSSTSLLQPSLRKRQTGETQAVSTPTKNVKFDENIKFYDLDHHDPEEVLDEINESSKPSNPRSFANLCWFIGSIVVFYYSDLFNVIFYNQNSIHQ